MAIFTHFQIKIFGVYFLALMRTDCMNKTKEDFSPKHGLGQQEKKALLAVEKYGKD